MVGTKVGDIVGCVVGDGVGWTVWNRRWETEWARVKDCQQRGVNARDPTETNPAVAGPNICSYSKPT